MNRLQTTAPASDILATNLHQVRGRIDRACERAQRDPGEVTLVAITKTLSSARIRAAYQAGLRDFGENRLEEASEKLPLLRQELPAACWHMVGHVQSRKAISVPPLFDYLHSLDSLKLARRLGRFADERGQNLPVLIQCNVSGEATKSGFPASSWRESKSEFHQLLATFQELQTIPGLDLRGLMTMAPIFANPEDTRPIFARLAALRGALQEQLSTALPVLSMGMTNDYEIAIEEGATHVRIGRAIFGERPAH